MLTIVATKHIARRGINQADIEWAERTPRAAIRKKVGQSMLGGLIPWGLIATV